VGTRLSSDTPAATDPRDQTHQRGTMMRREDHQISLAGTGCIATFKTCTPVRAAIASGGSWGFISRRKFYFSSIRVFTQPGAKTDFASSLSHPCKYRVFKDCRVMTSRCEKHEGMPNRVLKAQVLPKMKDLKSDEFSFVFLRRLRFGDGRRPIAL
jgi:hypothetical protein